MIIDIFNHCFPSKYLKEVAKTKRVEPALAYMQYEPEPAPERADFWNPATRIKVMDKFGIDIQVVNLAMAPFVLPPLEPLALNKLANDGIVEEFVNKYPERFVGLATLTSLTGEALDELDRCIRDLGLKGVQIFTNVNGKPLDSPEFLPFYEKMAKYDLPILIHPTSMNVVEDTNPWASKYGISLNWPYYSSNAMGMLVYGGVLQKYPNLKVVIHHLGGMIPFYGVRIWGWARTRLTSLGYDPIDYFKMFYADTATNGSVSAMKCGYDFFGPEHVVFATDYPYNVIGPPTYIGLSETVKSVKELAIPENEKQMIFEGNARRLLKMK